MYRAVDATGWYTVLYFVPLVLLGSIFMLNLFLAVLKAKFGQAQTLYKTAIAADANLLTRSKQKSLLSGYVADIPFTHHIFHLVDFHVIHSFSISATSSQNWTFYVASLLHSWLTPQ